VKPSRKYNLTPRARKQFREAISWYRSQSRDLAADFVLAVDERVESIVEAPERYPLVRDRVRRALVGTFPYAIFYVVEGGMVNIIACLHQKRHPKHWQGDG
jgi:plasmid stabilization system protein ParE